jgi:hypothetical protein
MDDLDETMPLRPSIAFCMGGTGSYMRKLDMSAIGYNAQGMFDLLVSSMVHPDQGVPGRCSYLAVVNEDYVEAFRSALAPFGVEVEFAGEELVGIVTSQLQEEMEKPAEEMSFLDVERVDASCVASLFESSAALFESAPWEVLDDSDVVSVDLSKWGMGERCICVMGAAGLQKGILMFDSYEDFLQFFRSTVEAARAMQPPKFDVALTSLTFSPTSGVSRTQRRDAMDNGWKLADVDAFPELAEIGVGAAPLPLRKESFVVATACAYALALFTRTHRKKIKKASGWMPGRKLPEMVRSEMDIPSFPDGPSVTVSFPHPTAHQQIQDAISQSVLIKPKKRR